MKLSIDHLEFLLRASYMRESFERLSSSRKKIALDLLKLEWIEYFGDDPQVLALTDRGQLVMDRSIEHLNNHAWADTVGK